MVDIAQYINEVKRDNDTLHIINDVQVHNIYIYNMTKQLKLIIVQNSIQFSVEFQNVW